MIKFIYINILLLIIFRNIKFEIISDKDKNLSLDLFQIIKPRITVGLIKKILKNFR
jgi:hypothetical protein